MFDCGDSLEVLDLSKTSTVKNDPLAQLIALNRIAAMDLRYSAKMAHDLAFDSRQNPIKIEHDSSFGSRRNSIKVEHDTSFDSRRNSIKVEHDTSFDSRRNSIKVEHDTSFDSRSFDGSENSKESLETSLRCGSNHSSESIDTHTSRGRGPSSKTVVRDEFYLERRRKNNQAAKKSRDAKRQRELQLRSQLILLQHENQQMKRALDNCVCRTLTKGRVGFLPTPYDFGGSYADSRYLSLATDLRTIETGKVL